MKLKQTILKLFETVLWLKMLKTYPLNSETHTEKQHVTM